MSWVSDSYILRQIFVAAAIFGREFPKASTQSVSSYPIIFKGAKICSH